MSTRQPAPAPVRAYHNIRAGGKALQVNGNITNIGIWPLVTAPETRLGPSAPRNTIFSVPPKPDFFQGRDNYLEEIHRELSTDEQQLPSELRSCLITAMGGMGKTRIALEYAHRYRKFYDCIFWLGAQQLPKLSFSFASIATKLGLPQAELMGGSRKYELVKEWLETTKCTWLLIFDNAESWDSLSSFWPNRGCGAIIVTSQVAGHFAQAISFHIEPPPLSTEEGSRLLLELMQCNHPSEEDAISAERVSDMVGGLPIAIAHMAGYMFTSKTNPKELRQRLETEEAYEIWRKTKTWTTPLYERTLDRVWHIALRELSAPATELLYVLSMLNPDAIPDELLVQWESPNSDSSLQSSESRMRLEEIRTGLLRRKLVDRGEWASRERYLTIHRSLQMNLRTSLVNDYPKRQRIFDKAVNLLRQVFPSQSKIMTPVNQHWDAYERYQPHLMSLQTIFSQAEGGLKGTSAFASLLSDEANYFWERNFLDDGVRASKLAVSILDNMDQPEPNAQAQALCLQGDIELEKGFSGRRNGLDLLLKTLDIRKRYINKPPPGGTPEEQLLYANAWNDFGCGLLEFAQYAEAERYLVHALEIKMRNTNKYDEPMEFAEAYMNLAMVRCFQSRYDEAKRMLEESVRLAERANGRHSACAQNFTFYWATILLNSEDFEAAREKHEDILEERKQIFGTFSLRTRHSFHALGTTYQKLGLLNDAEYDVFLLRNRPVLKGHREMFRNSLKSLDRFPCPDEYIARSQYNLAQLLKLKYNCKHEEATKLEASARKLRDRLLDQYAPAFEWGNIDELGVFDYMVSYKAGRTTMGQAPLRLFDVSEIGIHQSIAAFGTYDSRLHNPGTGTNDVVFCDQEDARG